MQRYLYRYRGGKKSPLGTGSEKNETVLQIRGTVLFFAVSPTGGCRARTSRFSLIFSPCRSRASGTQRHLQSSEQQ